MQNSSSSFIDPKWNFTLACLIILHETTCKSCLTGVSSPDNTLVTGLFECYLLLLSSFEKEYPHFTVSKLWSLTFPGTLVRTLTVITRNTVFHFSLTFSLHSPRIYSFWLSHQAWHMSHTSTLCSSNSSTTRVSVQECTLFIAGVNVYLSCEHFVHLHGVSSCIFHYVPIFIWSNVL